jgi:hypothetical protein
MPDIGKLNGTLSANGNSSQFFFTGRSDSLNGFYIHLSGTFGGGTINVQFQGADGTWRSLSGVSQTAAADKFIMVPNEKNYRLNLSGATGATIYYELSADGAGSFRV